MKFVKSIALFLISLISFAVIIIFEINCIPVGSSIAGVVLGFSLPALIHSIQDISDTSDWKVSQRKLLRGGFITNNTIVRISFAYLYRIKINNKYLLVKNNRGTEKFQPVGGVYKFTKDERNELKNRYQVKDDNKILIDISSRDDYRLRMENKYLRKFVKRFDRKAKRERLNDLGREFKEELLEKEVIDWDQITYRYCGRHMTTLHFGEHFQIYELLLADIIELIPTEKQINDLEKLISKESSLYYFASAEEITSFGIDTSKGQLREFIADHSTKILQENESDLIKTSNYGKIYTINLKNK